MDEKEKVVVKALSLSDFIELDFTLSIFGHEIIKWHFPPQKR